MRLRAWLLGLALLLGGVSAARPTPDGADAPPRKNLDVESAEVKDAVRYMMTELRRLSNRYRYGTLAKLHGAASGAANFDGQNLFLDVEFDMLREQRTRHEVILFKDETGIITGMAIDEFPEV